jgi:hypothetical protein
VRRRRRPRRGGLEPAEARPREEQRERVHESFRRRGIGQLDRDHAAEESPAEEPPRHRVIRMRGQTGVVRDDAALVEVRGNAHRARTLRSESQAEGLHPAVEEPRGFGIERAAEELEPRLHVVDASRAPQDRTRTHVTVAVQVLGRAVEHEVDADRGAGHEQRRRERVVGETHELMLARECDDRFEIGHAEERVRDRLHVDCLRVPPQRTLPRRRIRARHEIHFHSPGAQQIAREHVRRSVRHGLQEHVIAGREHREQRRGDGGHAARRD